RHDISQPHGAAGGVDALAVDPNMAGDRKGRGGGARANHPGMPKPLVDTLAIQCVFQSISRKSGIRFSVRKCSNARRLARFLFPADVETALLAPLLGVGLELL